MAERTPNYVDVVKRSLTSCGLSPHVSVTEAEAEKEKGKDKQNADPAQASMHAIDDDWGGQLTKQSIDAAKPYIPSYLAALKTYKPTVMLEGVPLKVNQKSQTWCSSTNVSNSILEPESTSSWADDDDDFLLTIALSQQKKELEMRTTIPQPSAGGGRKANNMREMLDSHTDQASKRMAEGNEGGVNHGYYEQKKRGWRKVEKGAPSCSNSEKKRGFQHNKRQGSNAMQNNNGNTTSNPAFLSCGRFDVLADIKTKKRR
ncbi:unnamed protein product [Phytomonas sp. Hart1]|nr:unnamed protein product [Phytomonas sp. Hart1]|eukprot:CCW69974.1 unnamed protein product [Phytomonas sp. isolate Hart1]